ncbi:MAG TPA: hypothetical protein VGN34_22275 [Ktedonobacteraceae bacterium]
MKRNIGLLSVLLGIGGFVVLILSITFSLGIVTIIGVGMAIVGMVGSFVSAVIEEDKDITSWSVRPVDGLKKPTMDKEQLPIGGYTPHSSK